MPSRPAVLPVSLSHEVLRISPETTPHKISLVVGTSKLRVSLTTASTSMSPVPVLVPVPVLELLRRVLMSA